MELEHTFIIPLSPERAWDVLLDVERIAPCLPGATLTGRDDDVFEGRVKVKVGPITVTYRGTARIVEADEAARRAVVEARGNEARGSGTAAATVTSTLAPDGDGTAVTVRTDLTVTGRPAQFGRGVMADVAGALVDRFAACLARELSAPDDAAPDEAAPDETGLDETGPDETGPDEAAPEPPLTAAQMTPAHAPPATARGRLAPVEAQVTAVPPPEPPPRDTAAAEEPLDLLDLAGGPVAARLIPLAVAALAGALLGWLLRGRRAGTRTGR